jgi:hypothetical protein
LDAAAAGSIYSAETYHVAHGKWETKAPIQSFIPFSDNGVPCVLGAFACTPLAKFPLKDLSSGANVRGTSVVELGSGNRPLDVFSYSNGRGAWVVTNTQRFKQPFFGPSKFWGVRVSLDLLGRNSPDQTNEKAVRRNVKEGERTEGIEVLEVLQGAAQIDKLSDDQMVVLREDGDKFRLEVCKLPLSEADRSRDGSPDESTRVPPACRGRMARSCRHAAPGPASGGALPERLHAAGEPPEVLHPLQRADAAGRVPRPLQARG